MALSTDHFAPEVQKIFDAIIKAEIEGDPFGRGYAGKTAEEQAQLMNAPFEHEIEPAAQLQSQPFAWRQVRRTAQRFGLWPNIVLRSEERPATDIVKAAMNAVATDEDQIIDPNDPMAWPLFQGGLAAFVASGDLTQQCVDSILALATVDVPAKIEQRHPRLVDLFAGFDLKIPAGEDPGKSPGPPNAVTADDITAARGS